MGSYEQELQQERSYLDRVLSFIRTELNNDTAMLAAKKSRLIAARKDMWENTVHFVNDFTRLTEINQYLSELNMQTADYGSTLKQLQKYRKIIGSPYFGRFDFKEEGATDREQIYIGLYNIMDRHTGDIYVYDWRAPIASIFYRHELGPVSYDAPNGTIAGDITLKRQYKIQQSELKYFFDCSIMINDEILQDVLRHNASPRMRNIVETIQKEQDIIIRDTANELLIVQGVAGSGKTSIALHRIAFLLYNGMSANLTADNCLILSPNAVFSKYISSVLPELGEENVPQTTFDEVILEQLAGKLRMETRNGQLESLITRQADPETAVRMQSIELKGSRAFVQILDRLIFYYERRLIDFEDVCYHGQIIETEQRLKNLFLKNKSGVPMVKRLKRIEQMILNQVHPLQKSRLEKIEQIVANSDGHELEVKSFSRLLAMKESRIFMKQLRRFTEVNYEDLYRELFQSPEMFSKLAKGMELPEEIDRIVRRTRTNLADGHVEYEDCAPLLYLKLRVEGSDLFSDVRQVVIDEAQDYYPLQYEVFRLLFRNARHTVLGDVHQAIEKEANLSLYSAIEEILNKSHTVRLVLTKGYRSSYEISAFAQGVLGSRQEYAPFERHEDKPSVVCMKTPELVVQAIARDIDHFLEQGYESIAVICKSQREAANLHAELQGLTNVKLITTNDADVEQGALVIPAYMAKGLEFDVVLVYGVSMDRYASELDRKLLYIACTRALHRLALYYTGEPSPFIRDANGLPTA